MTKFRLGIDAFGGRKTVYGILTRSNGNLSFKDWPMDDKNMLTSFLEEIVPDDFNEIVKITVHIQIKRGDQVALGGEG